VGLQTPNLGEVEAVWGSGTVSFKSALVSFYRPSIVTFFSIFTRFRDIAAFVLHYGHSRSFKVIYCDVTEKSLTQYIVIIIVIIARYPRKNNVPNPIIRPESQMS